MPSPERPAAPVSLFYSYSHKNEALRDELETHLSLLKRQGVIRGWHDRRITAGTEWEGQLDQHFDAVKVILLLVSADFLASDYCYDIEMTRALKRHEAGTARVIPVILRPCDWHAAPFGKLQALPRDGKPVAAWKNRDEPFADVARGIREVVSDLAGGASYATQTGHEGHATAQRIYISRLPTTGSELCGREPELRRLDDAWDDPGVHVLSLVAWGGVGKSALVNHWLRRMHKDHYRDAELVYGWSFYRDSTDQVMSAEPFIQSALQWFGDRDPTKGAPWDKGVRLAHLVRASRTLMVLDGLEPLQLVPDGSLKDQALLAFLRELTADNDRPGLCILSSRLPVADLSDFEGTTFRRIDLEYLTPAAGADLLHKLGVEGEQDDLEQASVEFGGHCLALVLLGSFLRDAYDGDITQRHKVHTLTDTGYGRHAQHVMCAYESWFTQGGNSPELAVLRLLGFFDHPADPGSVRALLAEPIIPGLTDRLHGISDAGWRTLLATLRRARLLNPDGGKGAGKTPSEDILDTHPLVREYFGRQVRERHPEAWREGHRRLYDHLRVAAPEFPETLEDMMPLVAAVSHGCYAGKQSEVFVELYRRRIHRGSDYYSLHRLGAFGADLTALSCFFERPWDQLSPNLSAQQQTFVLNELGYVLRGLGRPTEALRPMQLGLKGRAERADWENASLSAIDLSDLYIALGNLQEAMETAEKGVTWADKHLAENLAIRIRLRTRLADALHNLGEFPRSAALFHQAEGMQRQLGGEHPPLLYGMGGYNYCSLLLTQAQVHAAAGRMDRAFRLINQVKKRVKKVVFWSKRRRQWLLETALSDLLLGTAFLWERFYGGSTDWTEAEKNIETAVNNLQRAGMQEYLARGLLVLARLRRHQEDLAEASRALDKSKSIAARCHLGLSLCDAHIEGVRLKLAYYDLSHDAAPRDEARAYFEEAEREVRLMRYLRRERELEELKAQLL